LTGIKPGAALKFADMESMELLQNLLKIQGFSREMWQGEESLAGSKKRINCAAMHVRLRTYNLVLCGLPYVRRRTDCSGEKVEIAEMNQERIEGKWRQFRGALRERWGLLMADQRCVDSARREQSAGRALELYGINKQESQRALREFWHRNRRWDVTDR